MNHSTSEHEPPGTLDNSPSRYSEGWPEGLSTPAAAPRRASNGPVLLLSGVLLLVLGVTLAALAYVAREHAAGWLSADPTDKKDVEKSGTEKPNETKPGNEKPGGDPKPPPDVTRKEIAKNVYLETQGEKRRVVVLSAVCLRQGDYQLEGLLTRKSTKEHEYILAAEADGVMIHAALLAAGAEAGSPVKFQPKYEPARGTVIKITLRYEKDGKTVTVPAQQWIRNLKTKKDLDQDWVFAGSHLLKDPDNPNKAFYLANQGDFICVANADSAMLDLPVMSAKNPEDRLFEPFTDRIPPIGTKVEVIFEPVLKK
jgi:hypothetical protein